MYIYIYAYVIYNELFGSSVKCPLGHGESLRKTMIFALRNCVNPCESLFAKACESLRKHKLQKLAKHCETLRIHICEFARKLAKACEITFAKACET